MAGGDRRTALPPILDARDLTAAIIEYCRKLSRVRSKQSRQIRLTTSSTSSNTKSRLKKTLFLFFEKRVQTEKVYPEKGARHVIAPTESARALPRLVLAVYATTTFSVSNPFHVTGSHPERPFPIRRRGGSPLASTRCSASSSRLPLKPTRALFLDFHQPPLSFLRLGSNALVNRGGGVGAIFVGQVQPFAYYASSPSIYRLDLQEFQAFRFSSCSSELRFRVGLLFDTFD
jgi:hypothetical protein